MTRRRTPAVIRPFDRRELDELVAELVRPGAVAELAILVGCLVAAWIVVRLIRGRNRPVGSVWFGNRIFDGVLFPVLALCFAFAARAALAGVIKPAVFKVAIPILISLVVIRLSAARAETHVPGVRWVRIVERSISWIAWIGVVLWVTGVSPMVLDAMEDVHWKVGNSADDVALPLRGRHHRGRRPRPGALDLGGDRAQAPRAAAAQDLSLRKIAANVVRALLLFVGLLVALSASGFDLTALSVLGGAVGVGVGFGLRKSPPTTSAASSSSPSGALRIGDMVKVDTFEGRITDIRTRYTIIRSLGGREAIVPNETLITTRVENFSLADPRVLVQTGVQVAYGSDVRRLQPLLEAAIRAVPRVVADPAPAVQLVGVLRRRHGLDDQLLDPRLGERAGQRQVGRQSRRARRARSARASRSRSRSALSTRSSRARSAGRRTGASDPAGEETPAG